MTHSKFDDCKEVLLEFGGLVDSNGLLLGLFRGSPMEDDVYVIANNIGAVNYNPENPLRFKIDVEVHELSHKV